MAVINFLKGGAKTDFTQTDELLDELEDAVGVYPVVYSITNTLSGCSTNNNTAEVLENGSYSATISPNTDYTLTGATVSVTMGGNDITSTAYNNGAISIASVTGNVVITVSAVEENNLVTFSGKGTATVYGMGDVPVVLSLAKNGYCNMTLLGASANASNYQYNSSANTVDLTLNFSYNGIVITRCTGVFNNDKTQLSTVTFYGTNVNYITNNGSITISAPTVLYTFENYADDSALQSAFDWWESNNSWQKGESVNRLMLSSNAIQGNKCMQIKSGSSPSNKVRVTLVSDLNGNAKTNMSFWIKNNTGSSITLAGYIYKSAGLQNFSQLTGLSSVASDNEWHYVSVNFTSASVYNFSIIADGHISNNNQLFLDYISLE